MKEGSTKFTVTVYAGQYYYVGFEFTSYEQAKLFAEVAGATVIPHQNYNEEPEETKITINMDEIVMGKDEETEETEEIEIKEDTES